MRPRLLAVSLAAALLGLGLIDAPARLRAAVPASAGHDGTLTLAGLTAPVEVTTDRWGIPHLRAHDLADLYLAWGFVTARDRLFQLERLRRAGRGQLHTWIGNRALNADGGAQLFRLAERAHAIWARERHDPATRLALERFAAGVNAYLGCCRSGAVRWPPELVRLRCDPEDWRPEDSVLLLLGLGVLLDLDLPELRELDELRAHGAAWLAARRRYEGRWILDTVPDSVSRRLATAPVPPPASAAGPAVGERLPARLAHEALATLGGLAPPRADDGADRASNVFAVGARRSASGAPLLANDPHLALATPGPFHVVHVTVPGVVDAAGACIPGLPAIVSGRNRDCAWGVSALSADVVDVYADTLSADGRQVRWRGGWAPVLERPYALSYRLLGLALPAFGQARRYTPHGPVVALDRAHRLALSVRWSALEDTRITLARLLGVERSRDAAEVTGRFASLVTPTLNVVAADRGGHVRYQACGLLPRRAADPGPGPLAGDGRHEWLGFVAPERMPAWDVPASGVVVSANNRPAGPACGEAFPRFDPPEDRALRIAQRLGGDPEITLADLRSVQNDVYSTMAARVLPRLVACADSERGRISPRARAALDTLRGWDYMARRPRVAPTLWRAWFAALQRRWALVGLPGRLVATLDGEARDDPAGAPAHERPALAAAAALDTALADLERRLGPRPEAWSWARAHRARFARDLERWFPDEPAWRTATVAEDGDNSSPCVGPSLLPASVEVVHGPVFRHLVDLAVAESSLAMVPPANADVDVRGARALARAWADHGYLPLYLDPARIEAAARQRLTLAPAH